MVPEVSKVASGTGAGSVGESSGEEGLKARRGTTPRAGNSASLVPPSCLSSPNLWLHAASPGLDVACPGLGETLSSTIGSGAFAAAAAAAAGGGGTVAGGTGGFGRAAVWTAGLAAAEKQVRTETERTTGICAHFWALLLSFLCGLLLAKGDHFIVEFVGSVGRFAF